MAGNEFLTQDEITGIALLRASVGPHDTAVEVDPYFDAVNWHEAARGDGRSYGGVVETVRRNEGESFEDFYARCEARADELND
jgi:hypothetical protein